MSTLWNWNNLDEWEDLFRNLDRAFRYRQGWRAPFSQTSFLPGRATRAYPLLNLDEKEDKVLIEALAPGVDPESLNITIVRDQLTISGEKPAPKDVKPEAFHRNERGAGKFIRTLTLPAEVEADQVRANYQDGVLHLELPKAAAARPRQISVHVN